MNFSTLWQFLLMIVGAGTSMATLQPGGELDTEQVGIPPAFVTWQNGSRFTVSLHVRRTS